LVSHKWKLIPTTLEELVAPARTALIMVDLQNDFCSPGGANSKANRLLTREDMAIKRTKAVLEQARRAKVLPVFVQNTNLPNGLRFTCLD
jgi:nicotinamidase-related amidase